MEAPPARLGVCKIKLTAWDDVIERREIAANIKRESMHRDPVTHAHADRRDLAIFNPDAGKTRPRLGRDVEDTQRFD